MSNVFSHLRARPRPAFVPSTDLAALLSQAGIGVPLPDRLVQFFNDETGLDVQSLLSAGKIRWCELSAVAIALDVHPDLVGRSPRPWAGPWFITPTAIQQRIDLSGGELEYEEARNDLVTLARSLVSGGAVPRQSADGSSVYRGPRPQRLSVTVAPPDAQNPLPAMIAVAGGYDGIHITLPRNEIGGFDEKRAASFVGAFVAQRYGENSVSVAEEALVYGVAPRVIDEALGAFKQEQLTELREAATFLHDAVIEWYHQRGNDRANNARVGALRLFQHIGSHGPAFKKLRIRDEAVLRRLAESRNLDEMAEALEDNYSDLLGVAKRYSEPS